MGNQVSCFSKSQMLFQAIETGKQEVVQELLRVRPELAAARGRYKGSKQTAVEIAAGLGKVDSMKVIFQALTRALGGQGAVAVFSQPSLTGLTPVMITCQNGFVDCLRFLLSVGAASSLSESTTGQTALHHAVMSGSSACVTALLRDESAGLQTLVLTDSFGTARFTDLRTVRGLTALHLATAKGDIHVVEALIGNGASLDTPVGDCYVVLPWCGRGSTALHLAAALGHEAISRAIIAAQERTPSMDLVRMRNNQGLRPAQCAELSHHHRLAIMLSPPQEPRERNIPLENYSRLMFYGGALQQQHMNVPLRVSLLFRLKTMRKKQMEAAAAAAFLPESQACSSFSSVAQEGTDEADAMQSTMGPDAQPGPSLYPFSDPSSSDQPMSLMDSMSLSGLMSAWLGRTELGAEDLPNNWQLHIASIALNCAMKLSSPQSNMGLFNPMSSQHTSEILLHLGGKIMKNCLWPSDTSPGPSGRDDADKGEASMETEAQAARPPPHAEPIPEDEQCPICMCDDRACDTEIRPCKHRVCMPCAFEIVSSTCSTELLCPFCRTEVEDLRASAADDDEECEEEKCRESVDPEALSASETTPPEMAMSALDRTDYSRWTLIA